tara:strand:- start:216 stop:452 length:237 start_codon:yes stop_codon:yes gene_type:complete
MSLKKFHILFITLATICLLSFGLWCFYTGASIFSDPISGEFFRVLSGSFSLFLALTTLVYGRWFYIKKIKNLQTIENV